MKFEDIRIYDRDFELLTVLPKYISVNWEIKFKEFGSGEIELEKTDEMVEILLSNQYLFLMQNHIQSIVTGYKIGETITIFTRTLEWLLTKFLVKPFAVRDLKGLYSGVWSETRLVTYILENFLHQDFSIKVAGENDETDADDFELTKVEDIYSVIRNVLKSEKTGFKLIRDFEGSCFKFFILSANENQDIVICDEYKTSYNSEYNHDIQSEATGTVYFHSIKNMGKWNGSTNSPELTVNPDNYGKYYTVSEAGSCIGLSVEKGDIILCTNKNGKFEIVEKAEPFMVEIKPVENGIFSWSATVSSGDEESVKNEMKDKKPMDIIVCQSKLSYVEDFLLGDIVRVKFLAQDKFFQQKKLISQVHIWDEPDDSGCFPTMTEIE